MSIIASKLFKVPYADPLLKGGGSYMVYRIIGIDASIQNVRLNTSLAIQHFKCGNVSDRFLSMMAHVLLPNI